MDNLSFEKYRRIVAIKTLKINVKCLATEAKFIRQEIRRSKNPMIKGELNDHRIGRLRDEARHTQLAAAMMRGKPYEAIERFAKKEPDWDRIVKKAKSHYTPNYLIEKELLQWVSEGKKHFREASVAA